MKDPSKNVSAYEDFFMLVLESHVLVACMTVFKMASVEDTPSQELIPEETAAQDDAIRRDTMLKAVKSVLDEYVCLPTTKDNSEQTLQDHVKEYARDVLSLGLLYLEFSDAIRERDGERIIRCWKYLLLLFKDSGRTKYSIEAFTLLVQYHFLFSERMRTQLMWSRTVNVHGLPGRKISCDLHNEHLNRECKNSISGLGSNITDKSIERIGRSLCSTVRILEVFDKNTGVPIQSGRHTVRSSVEDRQKLVALLHRTQVFSCVPGREHSNFPNYQVNSARKHSNEKNFKWCRERFDILTTYH